MPPSLAIVLSAAAGSGQPEPLRERIEAFLGAAGRDARVVVANSGAELQRTIREAVAAGAGTLIVGGGDGSVSCAAGAVLDAGIPLGVLPLGTLNHFARDLGLPFGLDEALAVALHGRTRRVDVAQVNGRVFVNNSSLGLYPRILRLRARYPARGMRKWVVAGWATFKMLQRQSAIGVRITAGDAAVVRRTSLVLVANNEYRMEGIDAASRESLTDGRLAIYVVREQGTRHFIRSLWTTLRGRSHDAGILDVLQATAATIHARRPLMSVACDGEVEIMRMPLEYVIRPKALRVIVPSKGDGEDRDE
jgi:diacylglycerol kinase family enzyme